MSHHQNILTVSLELFDLIHCWAYSPQDILVRLSARIPVSQLVFLPRLVLVFCFRPELRKSVAFVVTCVNFVQAVSNLDSVLPLESLPQLLNRLGRPHHVTPHNNKIPVFKIQILSQPPSKPTRVLCSCWRQPLIHPNHILHIGHGLTVPRKENDGLAAFRAMAHPLWLPAGVTSWFSPTARNHAIFDTLLRLLLLHSSVTMAALVRHCEASFPERGNPRLVPPKHLPQRLTSHKRSAAQAHDRHRQDLQQHPSTPGALHGSAERRTPTSPQTQ
mmetsp:Transcript_10609/g.24941  ORF Transcript_10609/g.24941 Transcript_10609/m.24941 type:complete len:274 (-) Transcript_10609:24-845(-)